MSAADSLHKNLDDLAEIAERITMPDSPVGIDPKLTHAIIIDYLRQITARLDKLEARLVENAD